jgi:hypothetical protein
MSISPGARVEQVLVDRAHGVLAYRLGKQAQVIRRSRGSRLVVRFDGENHPAQGRRLLTSVPCPGGGRPHMPLTGDE